MIHPNRNPHAAQYIARRQRPSSSDLGPSRPATNPASPHASICQIVHGPWPKKMLETSAVVAPTMKPESGPNT